MQPRMEQLQAACKPAALEGQANAVAKMSQIISYFVVENDGMAFMMWQRHYIRVPWRRSCVYMEIT